MAVAAIGLVLLVAILAVVAIWLSRRARRAPRWAGPRPLEVALPAALLPGEQARRTIRTIDPRVVVVATDRRLLEFRGSETDYWDVGRVHNWADVAFIQQSARPDTVIASVPGAPDGGLAFRVDPRDRQEVVGWLIQHRFFLRLGPSGPVEPKADDMAAPQDAGASAGSPAPGVAASDERPGPA